MNQDNLYIDVKNKICDYIFNGVYRDGDKIPSERILADKLEVSRVTVRKSLELLEKEQLVIREVGSGTRVSLNNLGSATSMDMIVLVAPSRNPFFSEFISRFQEYADQKDSMVLYVEKPRKEKLEDCLYQLYKKGLQNAVIWLEDIPLDTDKLKRLRAMGMNMVFFDTDRGLPYADCVSLDNELAVSTLCQAIEKYGYENIGYVGWDRTDIYSIGKREQAFFKRNGKSGFLLHLPWEKRKSGEDYIVPYLESYMKQLPEALLCADGQIGTGVVRALEKCNQSEIAVGTIDELPMADRAATAVYIQNLYKCVAQIFDCLYCQNNDIRWKANIYRVQGSLKLHLDK